MSTVSETTNVPWRESEVANGDPEELAAYLKKLVLHIQNSMYPDLADGINNLSKELQALKDRYDAHTTHPPPA